MSDQGMRMLETHIPSQWLILQEDALEERECAICQEEMAQTKVVSLPCGHLFHKECIREWLGRKATCPTCAPLLNPLSRFPDKGHAKHPLEGQHHPPCIVGQRQRHSGAGAACCSMKVCWAAKLGLMWSKGCRRGREMKIWPQQMPAVVRVLCAVGSFRVVSGHVYLATRSQPCCSAVS